MKCIVAGCKNKNGEGVFVGDLCAPCHQMLTTGKIGCGTTFIHKMYCDLIECRTEMRNALIHLNQALEGT